MKADILFFSPTGNTRKVCKIIKNALETLQYEVDLIDLTYPAARKNFSEGLHSGDVLIVASPVYAHSAIKILIDIIKEATLKYEKAVAVSTHGGISGGNAVKDLIKLLKHKNIPCIAAAEIPMPHHFALAGIKNLTDEKTYEYSTAITAFIEKAVIKNKDDVIKLKFAFHAGSYFPQDLMTNIAVHSPKVEHNLCKSCRACLEVCPTGAIRKDYTTVQKNCIRCAACIKVCPVKARKITFTNPIPPIYLKAKLKKSLSEPLFIL